MTEDSREMKDINRYVRIMRMRKEVSIFFRMRWARIIFHFNSNMGRGDR